MIIIFKNISVYKVPKATKKLKDSSSPGPDRMTSRATKAIFNLMPHTTTECLRKELADGNTTKGEHTERIRERNIICIKKGKHKKIKSSQRISLLNILYKLSTLILTIRLKGLSQKFNLLE